MGIRTKLLLTLLLALFPHLSVADVTSGLVGRWVFTDGSGTSAVDSGPTKLYTSTLVNGVVWATGPYSRVKALDFDGTDDYASNNAGGILRDGTSNNLTYACWLYLDATGRNDFIEWKSSDGSDEVGFYVNASNKLEAYVVIDSSGGVVVTGATSLTTSTWYHVALTKSGNTWTIYLNHVSDGTGTQAAVLANHNTSVLWLGSNHSAFSPLGLFNLDGKVAFVTIYNRALSVSDITELNSWRGPILAPPSVLGFAHNPLLPLGVWKDR